MDVDLVRRATDESVLTALLDAGQLTRAEIAGLAGISRPTASESVRRLTELGLVVEAGRQTGARAIGDLLPGGARGGLRVGRPRRPG